ncbi:FAD-dependent oxidoreductase [Massilia sp. W12]|uniref:NAD(P)/FAD-dependent oxidoreductase n=1 Tax=Massilia sp. W12 TaxID=3126507 RepID=UPI0030CB3781
MQTYPNRQKVAVVGAGISGLAAAWALRQAHDVSLFEAAAYAGGHTNTVDVQLEGRQVAVDTGFLVFNDRTYPNLLGLFAELGVASFASEMSFGVSLEDGALEWAGSNLDSVFAQRKNLISPRFWGMLSDILRFNRCAAGNLALSQQSQITLAQLLQQGGYGAAFADDYLIPMAAAIWSSSAQDILQFPASTFLRFCMNHALLQINDRPQWRTVQGGGREYVKKILAQLSDVRLNTPVQAISRRGAQAVVRSKGQDELFDAVILATHAPDSLALLQDCSAQERQILSRQRYQDNLAVLHTDANLMPKRRKVWSAWNYLASRKQNSARAVCVTYWLNRLQNLPLQTPVLVSLNPEREVAPDKILAQFHYAHPVFDQAALNAQQDLTQIQGKNRIWFAGAWQGYGFHEDGLQSGLRAAADFTALPAWASLRRL